MEIRRLKPSAGTILSRQAAAPVRGSTDGVRALEARDLDRVAELHARVMRGTAGLAYAARRERLARVLLNHPWRSAAPASLVYEERGTVVGCIGIMPRPMRFRDRTIVAAISHNFMVEPGGGGGRAALALSRQFLSGPQDLSLAEGNLTSRRIWEAAGGEWSPAYSLCWTRPLAPSRYVLSLLRRRGMRPIVEMSLRPVCRAADALLPLIDRSCRRRAPAVADIDLDACTLAGLIATLAAAPSLRPSVDAGTARWLLETLALKRERGSPVAAVVRNARGEAIGWYLFVGRAGEIGAVVQIGARAGCAEPVLEHLFHAGRRRGLVALSGQAEPALFHALARKDCLFHHDGDSALLIHSRHPELLQTIHRGDAYLSRLDHEWWIGFLLS